MGERWGGDKGVQKRKKGVRTEDMKGITECQRSFCTSMWVTCICIYESITPACTSPGSQVAMATKIFMIALRIFCVFFWWFRIFSNYYVTFLNSRHADLIQSCKRQLANKFTWMFLEVAETFTVVQAWISIEQNCRAHTSVCWALTRASLIQSTLSHHMHFFNINYTFFKTQEIVWNVIGPRA
jgi:hypothetical protein